MRQLYKRPKRCEPWQRVPTSTARNVEISVRDGGASMLVGSTLRQPSHSHVLRCATSLFASTVIYTMYVLYCTVLGSVLGWSVLYCTVLYCTVLYCTQYRL
jgi:hypothetical protein